MISPRETISAALFNLISQANYGTITPTFTRKYISAADLGTARMPMICILVKSESASGQVHGLPLSWKLEAEIFVFVSTTDTDTEPETVLNTILDAIEAAVAPPVSSSFQFNRQTLCGSVYDCRINGSIERDPGFIGGIGAAAIPIEITTTA